MMFLCPFYSYRSPVWFHPADGLIPISVLSYLGQKPVQNPLNNHFVCHGMFMSNGVCRPPRRSLPRCWQAINFNTDFSLFSDFFNLFSRPRNPSSNPSTGTRSSVDPDGDREDRTAADRNICLCLGRKWSNKLKNTKIIEEERKGFLWRTGEKPS